MVNAYFDWQVATGQFVYASKFARKQMSKSVHVYGAFSHIIPELAYGQSKRFYTLPQGRYYYGAL